MFIQLADAQIYGVSFGNSPRTILAMGGWAGSWELWTEPFITLSETWRTVAYDHRGTGATIAPIASITFETMVADVFAIMDAFAIEKCVLAAESAGVAVALQAAIQQPQRFNGLVLADGVYYRAIPEKPDPFVLALKTDFSNTIKGFVKACVPEPDSAAIHRWGQQILARSEPQAAIRLYECLYGVDLRPHVSQIALPTLILHGEADALAPVSNSEWLAAQIPNSRLQIFKNTGHVPTVTRPREVALAINQFFDSM